MPLIKDEQVVEALCPHCSHEALREHAGVRVRQGVGRIRTPSAATTSSKVLTNLG
jgi:hypothetical protein